MLLAPAHKWLRVFAVLPLLLVLYFLFSKSVFAQSCPTVTQCTGVGNTCGSPQRSCSMSAGGDCWCNVMSCVASGGSCTTSPGMPGIYPGCCGEEPTSCSYSSCNSNERCVVNDNQALCAGGGCSCYSNLCTTDPDCYSPNLQCSNITVNPTTPWSTGTHSAGATLTNVGSANSGAFVASLYLDCNPQSQTCTAKGTYNSTSIASGGGTATASFPSLSITTPGSYTYYVKADSANAVTEKNETDNFCSASFNVCNGNAPPAPTFSGVACTESETPTWTRDTYSYIGYCSAINKTEIERSWYSPNRIDTGETTTFTKTAPTVTGSYILKVRYSNNGGITWGNWSAPSTIGVDNTRPSVSGLTVTPTCSTNKRPTWSWTNTNAGCFTTNKSEVSRSWYPTPNLFFEPVTSSWTPTSDLADGANTLTVRLYENTTLAGGFSLGSTYNVDTTGPTVSGGIPTLQCSPSGQSVGSATYTITPTDSGCGNTSYTYAYSTQIDTATPTIAPYTTNILKVFSLVAPGAHYGYLYAKDALGNTGSIRVDFTIATCPQQDFTMVASPTTRSIYYGDSTTYDITFTPTNSFNFNVTSSILSGCPSSATCNLSTTSGSLTPLRVGATQRLTVTSNTASAGSYLIQVGGQGGGQTHSATVDLTIKPTIASCSVTATPATVETGLTSAITSSYTLNGGGSLTPVYAWTNSGGTPSNPTTSAFTWTATNLPAGTYDLALRVSEQGTPTNFKTCTGAVTVTVPTPPTTKYSCNTGNYTCYENSSGTYSALADCQTACVSTPPTNTPPMCLSLTPNPANVTVNTTQTFTAVVKDVDNDTLTYSWTSSGGGSFPIPLDGSVASNATGVSVAKTWAAGAAVANGFEVNLISITDGKSPAVQCTPAVVNVIPGSLTGDYTIASKWKSSNSTAPLYILFGAPSPIATVTATPTGGCTSPVVVSCVRGYGDICSPATQTIPNCSGSVDFTIPYASAINYAINFTGSPNNKTANELSLRVQPVTKACIIQSTNKPAFDVYTRDAIDLKASLTGITNPTYSWSVTSANGGYVDSTNSATPYYVAKVSPSNSAAIAGGNYTVSLTVTGVGGSATCTQAVHVKSYGLFISPSSLTVAKGSSGTLVANITENSAPGYVYGQSVAPHIVGYQTTDPGGSYWPTITASSVPEVGIAFSPASCTPTCSSTITYTPSISANLGNYYVMVETESYAAGNRITRTYWTALTITSPANNPPVCLSLTPTTANVGVGTTQPFTAIVKDIDNDTLTYSWYSSGGGSFVAPLTGSVASNATGVSIAKIWTSGATVANGFEVNLINITDGKSTAIQCTPATVNVTAVTEPDFSVNIVEPTLSTVAGTNTSFNIQLRDVGVNWTTATPLACVLSPTGPNCTLSVSSIIPSTTANLTGTISGTTGKAGSYIVTVTGGPSTQSTYTRTRTDTIPLTITPPASTPDFTMSLLPATRTVDRGTSALYTITYASLNSWTTALTPTISGCPINATNCSLSPISITPTGVLSPTQTLTVTTTSVTPATYTITVIASATQGATTQTHQVSPSLTVLLPLACSITPASFSVQSGLMYSSLVVSYTGDAPSGVTYSWGSMGLFSAPASATTNWTATSLGVPIPTGSYTLSATVTDVVTLTRTVTCTTNANVTVETRNITGTVYYQSDQNEGCSTSGASVASGVTLSVDPVSGSTSPTTANPFSFNLLALGTYLVTLSPPTGQTLCDGLFTKAVTLVSGSNQNIEFILNDLIPAPWFQVYGGDVNANNSISMDSPQAGKAFYSTKANAEALSGAGISFGDQHYGIITANSFTNNLSSTELFGSSGNDGWSIAGADQKPVSFPALYDPTKSLSVLLDVASSNQISRTDLTGSGLSNGGIYELSSSFGNNPINYKINGTNPAVATVIYNGDLTIYDKINKSSSSPTNTTLIVVVNGDLTITKDVTYIEATLIVTGETIIEGEPVGSSQDGKDKTLVISGGLYSANIISLNRDRRNISGHGNEDPALLVNYDPAPLILKSPPALKEYKTSWVEIRD